MYWHAVDRAPPCLTVDNKIEDNQNCSMLYYVPQHRVPPGP